MFTSTLASNGAFMAVNLILTPICCYLYWSRRKNQPIRERGPQLVVLRSVLTLFLSLYAGGSLIGAPEMTCLPYISVILMLEAATIGSIGINIYVLRLDVALKYEAQINSRQSAVGDHYLQKSFQKRNKFNSAYSFTVLIWTSISIFLLTLIVLLGFGVKLRLDSVSQALCHPVEGGLSWYTILAVAYYGLFVWELLAVQAMMNLKEKFYLSRELLTMAIFAVIKASLFLVNTQDSLLDLLKDSVNFVALFNWHFFCLANIIVSLVLPYKMSFWREFRSDLDDIMSQKEKDKSKSVPVEIDSIGSGGSVHSLGGAGNQEYLTKILSNQNHKKIFRDFLANEFAVENLLFYDAAVEFKEKYSGNKISRLAMIDDAVALYDKYIDVQSPLCVNISAPSRRELARQIKGEKGNKSSKRGPAYNRPSDAEGLGSKGILNNKVFDRAVSEVFNLMAMDTFRRFTKTPEFEYIGKDLDYNIETHAL